MDRHHPKRDSRHAWWAVLACVVCLVVYVLGCVMSRPSWSPDSSRVALLVTPAGDDPNVFAIFTYDVQTGSHVLLDHVHGDGVLSGPAWSPDGKWIAYYRVEPSAEPNLAAASPAGPGPMATEAPAGQGGLPGLLWDLAKAQAGETAERVEVRLMAVTPDGMDRKVLHVTQWAAKRKDVTRLMVMSPAWSRDSRHLFYAEGLGELFSIADLDMATGRAQALALSSTGSVAPSPDGKWVATLLVDRSQRPSLVLARTDGQMVNYIRQAVDIEEGKGEDQGLLSEVSWSADSRRVLVSLGKQMLVTNASSGEGRLYTDPQAGDMALGVFSPAGDTLYYLAGRGQGDPNSGRTEVDLKGLTLATNKTRTIAALTGGLTPKTVGTFSIAPNGKAAMFRCTVQDPAGNEEAFLVLWDGKKTKTIQTDPWFGVSPGNSK